jgi:hypothetical protein
VREKIVAEAAELARMIVAVVIGVILALILFVLASRSPGHNELYQQQQMVSEQLRYVSCLLLIPPDERVPEAVAGCQITPTAEPGD